MSKQCPKVKRAIRGLGYQVRVAAPFSVKYRHVKSEDQKVLAYMIRLVVWKLGASPPDVTSCEDPIEIGVISMSRNRLHSLRRSGIDGLKVAAQSNPPRCRSHLTATGVKTTTKYYDYYFRKLPEFSGKWRKLIIKPSTKSLP